LILANKKFPRLRRKTNIVYIGMTRSNLRERLLTFPNGFKATAEGRNFSRRKAIKRFWNLQQAGFNLKCKFYFSNDPKKAEQKLLNEFEKKHLELPPLNHKN